MKTQIIFTILALIAYINANSATISISKKDSKDPTNVCNNSTYYYVTSISGAPNGYTVSWLKTNADISTQSTSEAGVKWTATSDANGYIGTIQAQLKNASGTVIAESNTITVTIKSILHMEPTLTPITNGTTYNISPCSQGQISLEVTKLEIPGTVTNPDKIYNYAWYLPPEWSANGQTSITGNDPIYGGSYITATYPASSTSGTIKVKGYEAIIGCDATVQSSKLATATINRDVTLSLSANKSYFLCGDTTPITYTVTASPALPCALYYWNNSSTATPSNTFQKVPALGNENVTVTVVYGNNSKTLSITVPVKTFNRLKPPIEGPDNVCGTQQVEYTIPQIRSGYTTVWEYDKLTPVLLDNDHAIFTANGNGYGSVGATVYSQCGGVEPLAEKTVWLGLPPSPSILSLNLCGSTPIEINAQADGFVDSYQWTVSCGTILNGQGTSCIFVQPNCSCNEIYVQLQTQNSCGYSPVAKKYIPIDCTGPTPLKIVLSPNPATAETTVSFEPLQEDGIILKSASEPAFDINEEWEMEVFSEMQALKTKKTKLKGKSTKLNTNGWKEGIYIVRVKYKNDIFQEKLIVKK